MAAWIIFYDDGSTYSDEDGDPLDAPDKGVVCIACRKQAMTLHQHDWYYWHAGHGVWWNSDIHGLLYQLRKDRDGMIRAVRIGSLVSEQQYQSYMAKAFEARTT